MKIKKGGGEEEDKGLVDGGRELYYKKKKGLVLPIVPLISFLCFFSFILPFVLITSDEL